MNIGDRVQAVDDLGRWETAKILDILPNGSFKVTFCGWSSEWDREVKPHEIRKCVPPLEQQERRK